MPDLELGWAWFETDLPPSGNKEPQPDRYLAQVFARCFRSEDGIIVLQHLKSITQSRGLGPAASDALLRHMEGQRQLVTQIISLVEQGQDPCQMDYFEPTQKDLAIVENTYD